MKKGFELAGTKKAKELLRSLGPAVLEIAAGSLYRSSEEIMTVSKEVYCPVDTGTLRSTGRVELPVISGNKVEVVMGYGGPSADYAVYVHEIDKNYNNGKQWKYLETPLKEGIPSIERNLVSDMEKGLRKLR